MSSGTGRDQRRRRILQKGEDRLALITGRKPNLSAESIDTINASDGSPPFNPPQQQNFHQHLRSTSDYQPSVSRTEGDRSTYFMPDQATNLSQDEALIGGRIKEESMPFLTKPERVIEPPRASASEDKIKGEGSSGAQKVLDAALGVIHQIPIQNVTSQQVAFAVLETEYDRLLCAVTVAILVVLSSAGFWIVGSKIFRGVLLFRPLFLVIITNITLIIWRLLPGNRRKLVRGDKDANPSPLGDGYAWAEEAGRALELGLMFQNVTSALFMDCSVYTTIVIFGISLFG